MKMEGLLQKECVCLVWFGFFWGGGAHPQHVEVPRSGTEPLLQK